MTRLRVIDGLDAAKYKRHPLHAEHRDWPEKNCYADLWIEMLYALGMEPMAILGHVLPADFIGDQWTFFKPSGLEMRELYGIDVQEMTVWRPLLDHALEHMAAGRIIASEVDAFWLPDTAGTDYRKHHTKTTIAFATLDTRAKKLGYFHNAGFYELEGEDYDQVFAPLEEGAMPLFAELVHISQREYRTQAALAERALRLLGHHMRWRPKLNPFREFTPRFHEEIAVLHLRGLSYYHQWAFASLRQAGAAYELAAAHVDWLGRCGHSCGSAAKSFRAISATCKSLILKGARVAFTGKAFDATPALDAMAEAWEQGMDGVEAGMMAV